MQAGSSSGQFVTSGGLALTAATVVCSWESSTVMGKNGERSISVSLSLSLSLSLLFLLSEWEQKSRGFKAMGRETKKQFNLSDDRSNQSKSDQVFSPFLHTGSGGERARHGKHSADLL